MADDHAEILDLGGVVFDQRRGVLTNGDGQTIPLRPQSVQVLNALASRQGQAANKDDLISEVWGSVNVTDESLVQCIADIRRAIGDQGHTVIQTLPKVGYRLVPPIPLRARPNSGLNWRHIGIAIAVLPVLVILVAILTGAFSPNQTLRKPSIAVLPFSNLSDDVSQAYFADGIVKAITTNLSKFEGLFVVSSFSAFQYRSNQDPPDQIAEALGVRYLLSGDVQTGPDQILINAQLTDAVDGTSLWSQSYTAPRTDVFKLQEDLSARIASTLVERVETATSQWARTRTADDLTAYELILRSESPKIEREALNEAIALLEQAIALSPEMTIAHSLKAQNYLMLWRHSLAIDLDEALRQARVSAAHAIELDNNSYQAYHVLSQIDLYADHDHAQALASLTKALEINPNEADLMVRMATLLGFMNRDDEAILWIEKAFRQNPLHPIWYHWNSAFVYVVADEDEKGIVASKKALAVYTSSASIRRILIAAHGKLDEWEQAEAYAAEIMAQFPDFRLSTHMRNSPFQDRAEKEKYWQLFRRAGLPD